MNEKRYINRNESVIDTVTHELVNAGNEESAEIFVDLLNEKERIILIYEERISELQCEIIKLTGDYQDKELPITQRK